MYSVVIITTKSNRNLDDSTVLYCLKYQTTGALFRIGKLPYVTSVSYGPNNGPHPQIHYSVLKPPFPMSHLDISPP